MAKIKVYTTHDCPYCTQAKAWLDEHGCDYEEAVITENVETLREWRDLSGGAGVPVVAHGNDIVIGFNPTRFEELLDCCEHTTAVDVSEADVG